MFSSAMKRLPIPRRSLDLLLISWQGWMSPKKVCFNWNWVMCHLFCPCCGWEDFWWYLCVYFSIVGNIVSTQLWCNAIWLLVSNHTQKHLIQNTFALFQNPVSCLWSISPKMLFLTNSKEISHVSFMEGTAVCSVKIKSRWQTFWEKC